ncbi:hypothetical protein GF359_02850 [candidate division WOR-3 bacterium]|uniref:Uncharacterized protein n=1 Tax=candidate division WOR-3 bacterium TaxID=2052148 RepID=A0A9D5K899_UNCW3|nr:hypothetical protein [candidate division WOR-3 bacterium]MBD3364132.1 hypothetical protein [candidate division WOR-3 bacterium]
MIPFFTFFLIICQCFFLPRIELCEDERVIIPSDDLVLPDADTVLTGTMRMLSDKLQSLDIVSVDSGSAYRRARILLDAEISPHWGGIITARIHAVEYEVSGYMMRARLLECSEEKLNRNEIQSRAEVLIKRQSRRLSRFLQELGFAEWSADGSLVLEGYAFNQDIVIWSVTGKGHRDGILEKYPVLVIWTDTQGRLERVFLTSRGHVYEIR